MNARISQQKVERARLQYEKVLRLYRARPSDELYDRVQRAHHALQEAQRDAVVARWSRPATVCPRCETPLSRRAGAKETRYGCIVCGFSVALCR